MKIHPDANGLVAFVKQPDGSIEVRAREFGCGVWDIMQVAVLSGWTDPGFTEPLDATADRAAAYLREAFNGTA